MINRSTGPARGKEGVQVVTAFATNCDDVEQVLLLKEPLPMSVPSTIPPVEVVPGKGPAREDPGARVENANTSQLESNTNRLFDILSHFNDRELFPTNPKGSGQEREKSGVIVQR